MMTVPNPPENERIRTTRILCLHGCHGSAAILRRQIAPFAAGLPADVELIIVDAPSLSSGDFGWWHEGLRGWERTRDWAIELFSSQHFDGIFGFSQGAALAGMLAAVREAESAPLSFDLAIMVSGFTITSPQHAHLFERKLTVPSLHVMGHSDGIVPMRDSLLLAERFSDPIVIEHGGGHVIPGDPAITTRIAKFVAHHAQVSRPGVGHG
jgi:pimeloyl-ACP methyl ester carboxylesterase